MSEGALLCVAPAVAAAVRDATGVVIRDLPLTPERVWRALQELPAEPGGPGAPSPTR
jgi:CO/xanthine dehydrogenase Mo-binding subunit